MRLPLDVAPRKRVGLPETGLSHGWEPTALMVVTLILLSFGLVTLYSASGVLAQRQGLPDYYYVVRQAMGAALGLAAMVICIRIPYHWWKSLSWPLLVVSWILLMILIIPGTESIAPVRNGARRWITLGVAFQPSELAKIALIVWTAGLAVKKQGQFQSLRQGLLPFLIIWTLVLVPIVLEPDLSTACLVAGVVVLITYAAGGRLAHFLALGVFALPLIRSQLGVGFRAQRLLAFLDPASDPSGAGFQVKQSLVAIGSGGMTGVGFGEGRQKFGFLPEIHNDFIFATIGEEWGFVGVVFTVALYLSLILIGFRVARRAPDLFGELLAIGITSLLALQAFLHMCVVLSLTPATGLALPLVSYGRSNLMVTLAALGILVAVARTRPKVEGRTAHA